MSPKEKFIEFDMKPVCKKCFEHFPYELKKRLKKANDQARIFLKSPLNTFKGNFSSRLSIMKQS